jgi:hypothetical protein
MRKRLGLLLACACFFAVPIGAHAATVTNLANVTADDNGDNEVDIAVNPRNPRNLVAGWNDYGFGKSCGVGYSTDGGRTWHTDWLRGMTPDGGNPTYDYGAGDPSVGFTNDGTAVFICNAWSQKKPTALYSTRSTDGGRTWAPVQQIASEGNIGKNIDHPMMTIDQYGNRVLVAYTIWNGYYVANSYALVSRDGGQTYQGPYRIAADYKANSVDVFDASLAGAPDGTIYATTGIWQFVNEWNEQAVVVSQMRPGETSFTRSVKVRDLVPMPYNLPGESWRTSMQGSIGVESDGTVDELTGDYYLGNSEMILGRSYDHGLSFPAQQNVSNDAADQVMPWESVRPNGRIDTIFYNYYRDGTMDAVYGQIAPKAWTMTRTTLQRGIDGDAQPPRGPGGTSFWGDYIGIDALDSLVAVAWTGNGPLSQDIWAATLKP